MRVGGLRRQARREGARGYLWPSSWGRALAGGMVAGEVANEYLGHAPKIRFFQRDHKSLKEEEHNYYQHDGRHNG